MTRPFVTHEQQIMGSLPTADVLEAIDGPLQNGVMDWNAMAPMASLLDAGDVLVQYDQAYERYDTPNPQTLAAQLATTPPGLSRPRVLRHPRPQRPAPPPLRRGHAGPAGQRRLAGAAGLLHRGRPAAHRPHRVHGHAPGGRR